MKAVGIATNAGKWSFSETISRTLVCAIVCSLPIMLFNPMVYRLQVTEALVALLLLVMMWRMGHGSERLVRPPIALCAVAVWIGCACVSVRNAPVPREAWIETGKLVYLWGLAYLLYHHGVRYRMGEQLWNWMAIAFGIVLGGVVLGLGLLLCGVENALVHPYRIIAIALNIDSWVDYVPRAHSFLQPTANMLGAYLAGMTLPVMLYMEARGWWPSRWRLIAGTVGVLGAGALTMSRTVVGILVATGIGWYWIGRTRKWRWGGIGFCVVGLLTWFALIPFTVFYPLHVGASYSTHPDFKKEMIVDDRGRVRPNPVYFLRPGYGMEQWTFQFGYGFNHYAWLKYGAWTLFRRHPVIGLGLGQYGRGRQALQAEGVLPPDLHEYASAQSQYATSLAEMGLVGFLVGGGACVVLGWGLLHRGRRAQAVAIALGIVAIIALDIDVIAFRWVWGLVGIGLVPLGLGVQHDGLRGV
ncbi:MAG: hypothetical protein HY696_09620 [Deltaproteobacteria bacterium]|nr:hypothetical protein [Deltaproteobacteria bacterium]